MAYAIHNLISINLAGFGGHEKKEVVRMVGYKLVLGGLAALALVTADLSVVAFTTAESG